MASLFKKAKDRSSKEKMRTTSGNSINAYNQQNPLNAPTEVAQATQYHTARNANELSFKSGDFFHVLQDGHIAPDGTIEIYDPIKNLKGRAPSSCFKFFEKTHRPSESNENRISSTSTTNTNNFNNNQNNYISGSQLNNTYQQPVRQVRQTSTTSTSSYSSGIHKEKPLGNLFGVVLYDFNAERSDELSVSAGDIIFICAHHEYEWYIAKFLNKVGEVGLVPLSYVQLIDAVTRIPYKESPRLIIESENLPTVDEWKAIKHKHKASSKAVGLHSEIYNNSNANNNALSRNASQNTSRTTSITRSPLKRNISQALVLPIKTNIESFSSTNNKFWFLIRVNMSDGSVRSLCRYYEDFFNFHQKLLSTWPHEGGKFDTKDKKERILPFIPGPVVDVTESLCHKRLIDLNEYLIILLQLPDYISKSSLVISFFDLMDGDEISNDSSNKNSFLPVEPNRVAPNLKIINTDNRLSNQNKAENLSQSNLNRRSQYDNYNGSRNSVLSNKFNDYTSRRKSSSASSLILQQQQQQPQQPQQPQQQPQQKHTPTYTNSSTNNLLSNQSPSKNATEATKLKLKFYYNDDIFALSIPLNIKLVDLKALIVPKLDEVVASDMQSRIKIYSKNSKNLDQSNYDESTCITNDASLWNDENFIDKGKFLVIV
jgi:bud emergence protein 1